MLIATSRHFRYESSDCSEETFYVAVSKELLRFPPFSSEPRPWLPFCFELLLSCDGVNARNVILLKLHDSGRVSIALFAILGPMNLRLMSH